MKRVSSNGLDAELAILGGGLAGLSIACHLLQRGWSGRSLRILEQRDAPPRERNWCSWRFGSHPFDDCVSHRWQRWSVRKDRESVVQESAVHPYERISSSRFHQHANERIAEHPDAVLDLGVEVTDLQERDGHVVIGTAAGERLRVGRVLDARPPQDLGHVMRPGPRVDLVQDFLGWHVETERATFDAGRVTLMDFVPEPDHVHFVYVLPFSPYEALVESTTFAAQPCDARRHEAVLAGYLERLLDGAGYRQRAVEVGKVPMTTGEFQQPTAAGRIARVGTGAGWIKPSTGYSFHAIQRWCSEHAGSLLDGAMPASFAVRSRAAAALDRIFLAHLSRHPERMPELFLRMFREVPADPMVRFLSDRGRPADLYRMMRALPARPLAHEALRSARLWWRMAR